MPQALLPTLIVCWLLNGSGFALAQHPSSETEDKMVSCRPCHKEDAPGKHFPSFDCQLCHVPTHWLMIEFDHQNHNDCTTCHKPPVKHRTGPCIFCHDTVDWGHAS
jgi:hypothetical protein